MLLLQGSSVANEKVPGCMGKRLGFCVREVMFRGTKSLITQRFKSLISLAHKQGYQQALGSPRTGPAFHTTSVRCSFLACNRHL